jgi:hypothetical protein
MLIVDNDEKGENVMKLFNNHGEHDHSEKKETRSFTERVRQYLGNMFKSRKCKSMSHGSYDIVRAMSWPRGENWRRNHPKSLNKHHK